jgi:signal transduction histidine kinase
MYFGVRRQAWRQHDAVLASHARALAVIAEREGDDYEMVLPRQPADAPASYVEVWRPDGSVLVRSDNLGGADLPRAFARPDELAFADVALPDGRRGRAVALRFTARQEDAGAPRRLLLVIAEGTEAVDDAVAAVRNVFVAVGVIALFLIAAVTTWIMARGTRPLASLVKQIEHIDARTLATRLSHADQPVELRTTVRKFDDLLRRLEESFAREREFTADVSHELRTPLAGLRTLLEVTALANRSASEYQATIRDALAVVKQMGTMVENLLTMVRLEAGDGVLEIDDIDLHELVEECWSPHSALAASRQLRFENHVPKSASIRSDREKLRIVVGNLLANAAEYTEEGGWIEVTADTESVLSVADSGPPAREAELERMFDRLWRGDRARSSNGAHCGIGLALSRSLCSRLSLSLTASSTDSQLTFRIARSM